MSDDIDPRLNELTTALSAAEHEKTEAYLESDWNRVWELTNNEIPKLEREIAALTGAQQVEWTPGKPIDFKRLEIDILEIKNSVLNVLRGRPRTIRGRVMVAVEFSEEQLQVIRTGLESRVVFYQARSSHPVTVATLLSGPWTSDHASEWDAEKTAENAREGIDDLRLIIQDRSRRQASSAAPNGPRL